MAAVHRPTSRSLLAAALGLASCDTLAASLVELLQSVPPPPADVTTALSWTRDGQIVAPEYTGLRQALEAERAAIAALNGGTPPVVAAVPSAPGDVPQVQGAIASYRAYLAANSGPQEPAAALGRRTRWLQAAMGGQLAKVKQQMKPCAEPCADPAALEQNQPLLARKRWLAQEDLRLFNTLFTDWKTSRSGWVATGEAAINAVGEGARAATPQGRAAVAQYRAALLREIESLLSITELAVKRADAIEHDRGGVTPDGKTGATRTAGRP